MDKTMINEFSDYFNELRIGLLKLDTNELERVYYVIREAVLDGLPIYLFGNGGSAAIANHWVCDLAKGISEDTKIKTPAVISLSSNIDLITAIANDLGYEYIFSKQLEYLKPPSDSVAIAISSSGNSPNIVNGLAKAKELNMMTIAMTGFHGGKANGIAEFKAYVPVYNYGVVEDIHMMILHGISQRLRSKYAINPENIKL